MRKLLLFILLLVLFVGCDNLMNTPTKKVEEFLNKFQMLDREVINNLKLSLDDNNFTNEEKDKYIELMKNQYADLVYTIKDEEVNGDRAVVKVEIEVYDYNKATIESDNYYIHNQDKFLDENGMVDSSKYTNYKLDSMKKIKERVKYTINFNVTKIDDIWTLQDITEEDRQKIHGLFSY